jgi:hypothetical protein
MRMSYARPVRRLALAVSLTLAALAALPMAACTSGGECDVCSSDSDCKSGFVCSTFSDDSRRCGSGEGATSCRVR